MSVSNNSTWFRRKDVSELDLILTFLQNPERMFLNTRCHFPNQCCESVIFEKSNFKVGNKLIKRARLRCGMSDIVRLEHQHYYCAVSLCILNSSINCILYSPFIFSFLYVMHCVIRKFRVPT